MTKGLSSGRLARLAVAGAVASLLIVAGTPAAQAAKRRVGVTLTGASAGTIHEAIAVALRHHGFEAVETDLGGDSDDAIAAAARQSHLAAVMVGEVRDGGKRLKLRVYGAAGDLIGEGSWAEGGGAKKLGAAVERTLWARVGGALSKTHALREKADKSEKAEKNEKAESEPEAAEEKADKTPPTYSRSKDDTETSGGSEEAEAPRKHKKRKAETEEEKEEESAGPTGAAGTALDLAVGLRFISRTFSRSPQVPTFVGYTLGFAPAVGVAAAWYPAAHFRGGWPSNIGLGTTLEYAPGLSSQDASGARFPTSESDYEVDGRYRLMLGGVGQVAFLVGGGQQVFIFHSQGAAMRSSLADLPDVQYRYARAGVDARFNLPANLALMVAGGYRYVLNAGKDNYLIQANQYLPNATFLAFDVTAAVGYRFLSTLEARAGFDLRRYQITAGANNAMVSSATDQYTGLWLQLAVLLDGFAAGEGGAAVAPRKAAPAPSDDDGAKSNKNDKSDKDDKSDKADKDE
jgi:hypothetical protein